MREYVSWPLFRAAEFSELVLDDNPYRRPLRPEDFDWLRFDEALTADTASRLSSLLGNRMLLGILEARTPVFAADMKPRWREHDAFYDPAVLAIGERLRPALMDFVFGYAQQSAQDGDELVAAGGAGAVAEAIREVAAGCAARSGELNLLESKADNQERLGRTVAIQLLALRLTDPLTGLAGSIPPDLAASDAGRIAIEQLGKLNQSIESIARGYSLGLHRHDQFQFYLPTTIALMNYLLADAADPTRALRGLGARIAATLHLVSVAGGRAGSSSIGDVAHTAEWFSELVVPSVDERYGLRGLREVAMGAREFAALLAGHQLDLMRQLRWIEADKLYAAKARRLQQAISDNDLKVDLDTFVETCDECSTAHVHDDTRLVVIDSGEMHFWNAAGEVHLFRPGDAMYVPVHRLHGSVVISGTCVYHQPVITPEIEAIYG